MYCEVFEVESLDSCGDSCDSPRMMRHQRRTGYDLGFGFEV